VDVKEFQLAWNEINDVHQFNRLLSEFGVTREQGLRLGPVDKVSASNRKPCASCWNRRPSSKWTSWPSWAMTRPSRSYSGKINKVQEAGGYFNVLDPEFNLHLRDSAWSAATSSSAPA
jgi:putative hemin transport protein